MRERDGSAVRKQALVTLAQYAMYFDGLIEILRASEAITSA